MNPNGKSRFKPSGAFISWPTLYDSLAQGVISGLGSMNKHGKGFMTGFWSAESSAITSAAENKWADEIFGKNPTWWEKDIVGVAEKGIAGGAVSRFGGKLFNAGLFSGAGAEALSDGAFGMEELLGNPEKPPITTGPVNAAFKLLTPKVSKKGVTYPLYSVSGGNWGVGSQWDQL